MKLGIMRYQASPMRLSLDVAGVVLGLAAVVGLSGAVAGGVPEAVATGDGGTDALNVTINVACTMAGSGGNTYNVSINPGQTTSDIGPTNIKTLCNDGSGYAIYAIGYSGDSYTGNNTKLIGTNSNIDTGTASTAGNNSYWAMKLSAVAGDFAPTIMNSFDSYHAVPSDFTMVAKFTAATDAGENAEGSNTQAYYEVKSSSSQVADTYAGKVKYILVHPNDAATPLKPLPDSACPASSICYAPNASDIDGSMSSMGSISESATAGKQTGVSTNGTAVLRAPNFSRDGYGFAGWSTDFEATSASKVYGPNETITTSTTAGAGDADVSAKGLILYPVWIASAGNIQNWTGCSSLTQASYDSETGVLSATLASMTALTDERDGNTYTVARLADGNCWMTENLRLNAENSTDASLAQGFGDDTANNRGKFIGLADSEDTNFIGSTSSATDPTNANSLYYAGTQSGTATMNIGQVNYAGFRIPRYNKNNTNLASNATNSADVALTDSYSANNDHARWFGYGNYYNWPAAMANTGYYNTTATDADGYTPSEAAGTSLCPTGWRLPYGRNTGKGATMGGFSYLDTQMGGTGATSTSNTDPTGATMSIRWRSFPNNFVYSGNFGGASALNRSSYGYYWSSTASNYYNSYSLYLYSSSVYPGTYSYTKSRGYSIRCVTGT